MSDLAASKAISPAARATRDATLFVVSQSGEPCGVEVFTHKLVAALQLAEPSSAYAALHVTERWRDLPRVIARTARAERVVFGLPLVAWKRTLLIPLLLLLTAFVTRRRIVLFMHEWSGLHRLRRLLFVPFVALSDAIVVLSPYIRGQIAADPWIGRAARKCRLIPHPPTIAPPASRVMTDVVRRVDDAVRNCDIVIGYFGAIYQGKAPDALLDVCDHLRQRGLRAAVVFVGSFTKSLDRYEEQFRTRVKDLALDDRIVVTGYVETEAELFALFERIGVFLFLFPEGMTARRSSVIACLQSGRPVIVSEPQTLDEFRHHRGLRELIGQGALSFVSRTASTAEIADKLVAAAKGSTASRNAVDGEAWWRDTTTSTRAAL